MDKFYKTPWNLQSFGSFLVTLPFQMPESLFGEKSLSQKKFGYYLRGISLPLWTMQGLCFKEKEPLTVASNCHSLIICSLTCYHEVFMSNGISVLSPGNISTRRQYYSLLNWDFCIKINGLDLTFISWTPFTVMQIISTCIGTWGIPSQSDWCDIHVHAYIHHSLTHPLITHSKHSPEPLTKTFSLQNNNSILNN